MKVLILSCNTGQGHNTAGRAVLAECERRGIECQMLDTLTFDSEMTSRVVSGLHNKGSVHLPKIYGVGVTFAHILDRTSHKKSVCYLANTTYASSLYRYIVENGFDTLVLPHVFPSEAITRIRRKYETNFRAYFIATDYSYPPFLNDTVLDGYFIPHHHLELTFAKAGIPREKLIPIGIPVAASFAEKTPQNEARRALELPSDGNILLVMTGSMGFGDTEPLVRELLNRISSDTTVVVMGGNNEKMKARLRKKYGHDSRLRVIDFTRQVSLYMDAADILFTKPGGLSSTEAAVKGIPIIHTTPIPGWEEDNIEFFRKHGLSLSGRSADDLVTHALWLLGNPWAREEMMSHQAQVINKFAARDILTYIEAATISENKMSKKE